MLRWFVISVFIVLGVMVAMLLQICLLGPLAQGLIDSEDDDVVLWAIRFFKSVEAACFLVCVAIGAAIGWRAGRSVSETDSN